MAEDQERDSKTEEPTERKLSDAIEKGNVPVAREAITLGSLAGILMACSFYAENGAMAVTGDLRALLGGVGEIRLETQEDAWFVVRSLALHVALALAPFIALVAAGGLIAALAQNIPQAPLERIRPQASRISMSAGWKRLFGLHGLSEFLKSLFKFLAVAAIAAITVKAELGPVLATLAMDPVAIPGTILAMTLRIAAALCFAALVLAGADLAWARFKWRRDLRMTRQEIKDEHKQQEGDPLIKFKIRQIARQRNARAIAKTVPTATMVITNPTHFAVALRYVDGENAAPVVVAKGIDHLARKIRELARHNGIPIVENQPLARALYDKAAVGSMIPAEFYKAVAEVIHFLQLRKMYGARSKPRTSLPA